MKAKDIVKWALTVFIIITNYLILFLLNMGYAVTKKYQLDQPWSDQLTPQGLQEIADMLTQSNCSAQLNQDTFLKEFCSYSMGGRSPLAV